MDNTVAEKFCDNLGLTNEQINLYENLYKSNILPIISRHYLSHLVSTIEELINDKKKQTFLRLMRERIEVDGNSGLDYAILEKTVNRKMLRLFSIILVPVDNGRVNARAHFMKGGYGVLITYWKQLPEDQIRILIAHELGHVAIKYLLDDPASASNEGLASLFGYIALQDRDNFYKNRAKLFTSNNDLVIYDKIVNICNRGNQ